MKLNKNIGKFISGTVAAVALLTIPVFAEEVTNIQAERLAESYLPVDCNPRFPFCNRLSHFVSGLQNLYPKFHFCNTIPVPRDDFVLYSPYGRVKMRTKTGRHFCLANFVPQISRLFRSLSPAGGLRLFLVSFCPATSGEVLA